MKTKIRYENVRKRIIKFEIDDDSYETNCPERPDSEIMVGSYLCTKCRNYIGQIDGNLHCFVFKE
jgi:hypothetical protein